MPDQLSAPAVPGRDARAGTVRDYRVHGNRVQGDDGRRAAPPPRPPVESRLPVPGSLEPPPRPRVVTAAVGLWALVVVAGLVALLVSAIDLEALRGRLLSEAGLDDRAATEQELVNGVVVTMATVALLCDAALLLAVWGLRLIDRRRSGAVRVLVVAAVMTLLVVGITQGMVAGGATELDRLAFVLEGALVLPATGMLLARRSRAWLRGDD